MLHPDDHEESVRTLFRNVDGKMNSLRVSNITFQYCRMLYDVSAANLVVHSMSVCTQNEFLRSDHKSVEDQNSKTEDWH